MACRSAACAQQQENYVEHPVRGFDVVQDHIGHLHHEPRHHDVGERYFIDVSAFQFFDNRQGLVTFSPLLLLSIVN